MVERDKGRELEKRAGETDKQPFSQPFQGRVEINKRCSKPLQMILLQWSFPQICCGGEEWQLLSVTMVLIDFAHKSELVPVLLLFISLCSMSKNLHIRWRSEDTSQCQNNSICLRNQTWTVLGTTISTYLKVDLARSALWWAWAFSHFLTWSQLKSLCPMFTKTCKWSPTVTCCRQRLLNPPHPWNHPVLPQPVVFLVLASACFCTWFQFFSISLWIILLELDPGNNNNETMKTMVLSVGLNLARISLQPAGILPACLDCLHFGHRVHPNGTYSSLKAYLAGGEQWPLLFSMDSFFLFVRHSKHTAPSSLPVG